MRFTKTKFRAAMTPPEDSNEKAQIQIVECYAIQAPKWKPLRLCVHKELKEDSNKWVLSDMATGLKISQFSHQTRDGAIEEGMERLQSAGYKKVMETIEVRKKQLPE